MKRIRKPQEAYWAFQTLVEGRKHRAVLQQHVPFTFHTSQLLITVGTAHPEIITSPSVLGHGHSKLGCHNQ